MDKKDWKQKTENNYEMFWAGRLRVISSVTFIQIPSQDQWSISSKEIKRVSKEVCEQILQSSEPLLLEEAAFICSFYKILPQELSRIINFSENEINLWRKSNGSLSTEDSKIIIKFVRESIPSFNTIM